LSLAEGGETRAQPALERICGAQGVEHRATEVRSLRIVRKTDRDAATVYAEPVRTSTAKGELRTGSCVLAGRTQAGPGSQGHLVVWVDIQTWEGRVHVAGWVLASSLVPAPKQVGDGGEPTPASP
jgi:hypothetical protein